MKISELNTKSFLGNSGAAANSYVLVNYAEAANGTPVTYKASLEELGKSIAANLGLVYDGTYGHGGQVLKVSNGAYAADDSEKVVGLAGSNTLRLVVDGGFVPGVLQINDTADGFGYYATSESDSWTPVTLGGGDGGGATVDASTLMGDFDLPTSDGPDISGATLVFTDESGQLISIDDSGLAQSFDFSCGVKCTDDESNPLKADYLFAVPSVGLVIINQSGIAERIEQRGYFDYAGQNYRQVVYDMTSGNLGYVTDSNAVAIISQ